MADVSNIVVTPSTTTDYQKISTNYLTLDDSIDLTTGRHIGYNIFKNIWAFGSFCTYNHRSGYICIVEIQFERTGILQQCCGFK